MRGEARVAVVEPDHEPHRDPVLAHRVDEGAAELAVLRAEAQRPAHRVDDAVERLLDLPHLLDPELPLLRVLRAEVEMPDRGAGEVALGALAEHGGLADQVGAGLEVRQLLAVAVAALVARADADHAPVVDQQARGRRLTQDVDAGLLGLLRHPAPQLRHRGHVVAVVAERGRGGLQRDRHPAVRQQVDRVLVDRAVGGPVLLGDVGKQGLHRRGVHHRPGQQVGARRLALLHQRHRHLSERLHHGLVLGQQLGQADRAGQARWAAAHDHHTHLDPLVLRVRGRAHELLGRVDRRRELDRRCGHQPFLAFTASVSLGMILFRSPTTPRSENSKIGAFGSLLIATMFSAFCMPTLCWMAPEIPAAR